MFPIPLLGLDSSAPIPNAQLFLLVRKENFEEDTDVVLVRGRLFESTKEDCLLTTRRDRIHHAYGISVRNGNK